VRDKIEWAQKAKKSKTGKINILGFPFDGTACYRKGAVDGPKAIVEALLNIETYSPHFNIDLELNNEVFDLGDLDFMGKSEDQKILNAQASFDKKLGAMKRLDQSFFIGLGGEHSISYLPIKKHLELYPDLVLIQLDAHADLRDGYEGHHYSHASVIRRSLEHKQEGHQLIQQGIRSGTSEEFAWMKKNKTLCSSLEELYGKVKNLASETPIYLTLDLDYFDPAYLPGTGTPEPDGFHYRDFIKLVEILQNQNWVGFDMVELSPELDSTGSSNVFAAVLLREVVAAKLSREKR